MQYHYANPPRSSSKREQEESNPHHWFWRPACCRLHHAPRAAQTPSRLRRSGGDVERRPESAPLSGAEGGNRTHTATGANGFTDRRNSILPPQHIRNLCQYSIVKQPKRSESDLNSKLRSGRSSWSRLSFKLGDFGSGNPLPLYQL